MALKATRWKIITIVHTDVCEAKHTIAKSEADKASAAWNNSSKTDRAGELYEAQRKKWRALGEIIQLRAIDRGESLCGCPIHATAPVEPELKERAEVLHAGDVKGWSLVRTERDGEWVIGYWEEDLA